MYNQPQKQNNNKDLLRYAGLGTQIFVALGLCVFVGMKSDKWLKMPMPIFAWVLPLLVICIMIYKLIKDTAKRKKDV